MYRLQGVNINDKHLEVISRQMLRWVRIEDIGDSEFLPEEVVDRFKFKEENARVLDAGGKPAAGKAVLLGITKASLSTDSFISAATESPNEQPQSTTDPGEGPAEQEGCSVGHQAQSYETRCKGGPATRTRPRASRSVGST